MYMLEAQSKWNMVQTVRGGLRKIEHFSIRLVESLLSIGGIVEKSYVGIVMAKTT